MSWTVRRQRIPDQEGEIVTLAAEGCALTIGDVIVLWRDDEAFRDAFITMLAASPYAGFFWEMPPVDSAALARDFECAIISSAALARMRADDSDFAEHLCGDALVTVFPNLGGDALLIAACKISDVEGYGHIASFVRCAPREQVHALLRHVAIEIEKRLSASRERFWVSTSGLGVPWVHVRLDKRPKYYQYELYR